MLNIISNLATLELVIVILILKSGTVVVELKIYLIKIMFLRDLDPALVNQVSSHLKKSDTGNFFDKSDRIS